MSDAPEALRAPEPLNDTHRIETFTSGASTLDGWLQRKARVNQLSGASRTYVICRGEQVVGFYALAAGSISHDHLPRKLKQNMPDPIPVIVLGRLAIDLTEQGNGLGRALLRDAVLRVSAAAREVGVAAILVHALNERAKAYYLAIPTPAAGKSTRGGRITPGEWESRTGLRLRFIYRRRGPSLLVAEGRLNTKGRAVASRSKTGRGVVTAPIFLLVPQVKLPKRLDLARDAERAHDAVPGLIVAKWVEGELG